MAPPDFNKTTIETLAKRAAYLCSNPDCRKSTVGPNTDPAKAILIAEAAHIYGARPKSKRYNSGQTDSERAKITNGIWLCRNCHKIIDSDDSRYEPELLFQWREIHENYVLSELGNTTDRIKLEQHEAELLPFDNFPSLVRRILIDKPDGWEWSLTSQVMRHLNDPLFRKISDLRNGLYLKPRNHVSDEEMHTWFQNITSEMMGVFEPIEKLVSGFHNCWGAPGESGDPSEIHHTCKLIQDNINEIVRLEEKIHFTIVPEHYTEVQDDLKGILASQALKLSTIPDELDGVVEMLDTLEPQENGEPHKIERTIVFDVPDQWAENLLKKYEKATKKSMASYESPETKNKSGYGGCVISVVLVIWILYYFGG